MQLTGLDEISFRRRSTPSAQDLPLGFGRQARTGPARERIGLEEADVADRRMRIDLAHTGEGEFAVERFGPVQRPLPSRRSQTVFQPSDIHRVGVR